MTEPIKGLSQLNRKLSKLKGISNNKDAILAGAFVLEKGSKERVAVDTGFLKNSITSEKTEDGAQVIVSAEYGFYQEFGNSKMAGKPYIRPTIDEDGNQIVDAVSKVLRNDISDIAKGG